MTTYCQQTKKTNKYTFPYIWENWEKGILFVVVMWPGSQNADNALKKKIMKNLSLKHFQLFWACYDLMTDHKPNAK